MAGTFKPFADDAAALTIGGMTMENGTDRVSLSGSLDLARDRQSLDHAKALRAALDAVIVALETEKGLPARAATPKPAPPWDSRRGAPTSPGSRPASCPAP